MAGLIADDFPAFFAALWDHPPFPWQYALLRRIAAGEPDRDHLWPDVLDLPTGSGKTAAIDIAVFHLALEAAKGEARRAPVRIAFVVDRRLIVDDAYARAKKLADVLARALQEPAGANPVVRQVARALAGLAGPKAPPLLASALRGGAPREDDWARTPVQPTVLCSTVDQVGSRLLFRGYGVSDRMKPIHAGLLGSDCLILLDEAHLARPFRQTLEAVVRLRKAPQEKAPFGFAVLTATPDIQAARPFGLGNEDRATEMLARRLTASKPARLVEITGKQGVDTDSRRIEKLVEETQAVLEALGKSVDCPAVGVVVNRVARARGVFDTLRQKLAGKAKVTLVIGPARPVDRDLHGDELAPIRTGKNDERRAMKEPLIVVATQTIEAGVDIDFDGLVTEAAAFDALRQRFGRLNRAGRPIAAQAAILAHKEDIATDDDDNRKADPVYGGRIKKTWEKLRELGGENGIVDFGINALHEQVPNDVAAGLATPPKDAPVLMPAYADLWSQTSPIPAADPDVALFLHGPDRAPASVQIVWRADISEALVQNREAMIALLTFVPPRSREAIDVPVWAAQRFLLRERTNDLSDAAEREPESDIDRAGRPAFCWAGEKSERTGPRRASELKNGDLIVVPATYGGCDTWGWDPLAGEAVADVADKAALPFGRKRFAVRVTSALLVEAAPKDDYSDRLRVAEEDLRRTLGEAEELRRNDDILGAVLRMSSLPPALRTTLTLLRETRKGPSLEAHLDLYGRGDDEAPRGVVFVAPHGLKSLSAAEPVEATPRREETAEPALPSTEDDEGSVHSQEGGPVTLKQHCADVRDWARMFAERAGLPPSHVSAVELAGWLHDPGKADVRWQSYVSGASGPYGAQLGEALAKSGKTLQQGAWKKAGLPDNWRHEALSVRLASLRPQFRNAPDQALVLWAIGTHHGYGRPFFPHADDGPQGDGGLREGLLTAFGAADALPPGVGPQSLAFTFDGMDWVQMFEHLKQEYGIWGLARLEAFVRLADHRASDAGPPPGAADLQEAGE